MRVKVAIRDKSRRRIGARGPALWAVAVLLLPISLSPGAKAQPAGRAGVIRVDPATGAQTPVAWGGNFDGPFGLDVAANGDILVADSHYDGPGAVIRVNPSTGAQSVVSSGGQIIGLQSIAVEASGDILVMRAERTSADGIVRVSPTTGAQAVVTQPIEHPNACAYRFRGLAVEASGDIITGGWGDIDGDSPSAQHCPDVESGIIRVDPVTGAQTIVSMGPFSNDPTQLEVAGNGDILMNAVNQFAAPGEQGRVIRVDPVTGAQSVVSLGGNLSRPYGIDVAANGDILVADSNFDGPGAVIRVNPDSGAQTAVSPGWEWGPTGLALAPNGDIFVTGFVAGEAAPPCLGRPSTIVGTEGDDTLLGTSEGLIDVISGLGGDDVIKGGGGKNRICGGQGNDTLSSGSGNDRLAGGSGRDVLKGGGGNDRLKGGAGKDTCNGSSGRDRASRCERMKAVP